MKKTISIIRIAILLALGMFAMLMIFGEETQQDLSAWALQFLIHKAIGIIAAWAALRLYSRWSKIGPWLKACDKMCDEGIDNPNPSQL